MSSESRRRRDGGRGLLVLATWFQVPGDWPAASSAGPSLWLRTLGARLGHRSLNRFLVMNPKPPFP